MGRLVEPCPPGDIGTWVCQAQLAAFQGDMDRLCDGGVESLRVVAVCLIHPALERKIIRVLNPTGYKHTVSHKSRHIFLSDELNRKLCLCYI